MRAYRPSAARSPILFVCRGHGVGPTPGSTVGASNDRLAEVQGGVLSRAAFGVRVNR